MSPPVGTSPYRADVTSNAIWAEGLVKTYGSRRGSVRALDGLDLAVPEGSVLGLLGPNGAGKTTAVRVLTTLLRPDSGAASVLGHDVLREPGAVRRIIGLSGQYAAVDEHLTGNENLVMVGRLYHLGRRRSTQRATELLARFDLEDAADRTVKTYSGGMRRRLDLAGALVAQPRVLLLDEPTTGLDPRSRIGLWDVIAELVREGTTLLLTSQYLEEVDKLADTVAVVDHGRIIAGGTSDELKRQVGGERLELSVASAAELEAARDLLAAVGDAEPSVDVAARQLVVPVTDGSRALVEAVRRADADGVTLQDVALRRPTLDDVFLTLTGRGAEDGEADAVAPPAQRERPAARAGR